MKKRSKWFDRTMLVLAALIVLGVVYSFFHWVGQSIRESWSNHSHDDRVIILLIVIIIILCVKDNSK